MFYFTSEFSKLIAVPINTNLACNGSWLTTSNPADQRLENGTQKCSE
jgi:hypothetical protein